MFKFRQFQSRSLILAVLFASFIGCSSKTEPDPLVSYTPDTLIQRVRFTVNLEIKVVDQTDAPISGVRIYAQNPYFHQYVFTGQSGIALISGIFSDGEMTVLEFEGQGIRWTEELFEQLPAGTKSITLKVKANTDGSIKLAGMRYYPR